MCECKINTAKKLYGLLETIEDLLAEHDGETSSEVLIQIAKERHNYLENRGGKWKIVKNENTDFI